MARMATSGWPRAGDRRHHATLQMPVTTTDPMGGRTQTWAVFGTWFVQVSAIPFVVSDTQATMLHHCEGLYRSDLQVGYRILVRGLVLKILALENPDVRNRTIVAHCGNALATNQ